MIRSRPRSIAQRWFQAKSGRRTGVRCRTSGLCTSMLHSSTARVPSSAASIVQVPVPSKSPLISETSRVGGDCLDAHEIPAQPVGEEPAGQQSRALPGRGRTVVARALEEGVVPPLRIPDGAGEQVVDLLGRTGHVPLVDERVLRHCSVFAGERESVRPRRSLPRCACSSRAEPASSAPTSSGDSSPRATTSSCSTSSRTRATRRTSTASRSTCRSATSPMPTRWRASRPAATRSSTSPPRRTSTARS